MVLAVTIDGMSAVYRPAPLLTVGDFEFDKVAQADLPYSLDPTRNSFSGGSYRHPVRFLWRDMGAPTEDDRNRKNVYRWAISLADVCNKKDSTSTGGVTIDM